MAVSIVPDTRSESRCTVNVGGAAKMPWALRRTILANSRLAGSVREEPNKA